jgi:hypothetical protein
MEMLWLVNNAFANVDQTMECIDQEQDQVALRVEQLEDDEEFDGARHGSHANIDHVNHEQSEIVGKKEANMLAISTCNIGQQEHRLANVHGTHMEAPSMGVGMVGAKF